ncbi:MAG TPA: HAMP domain-containing sensor histidine kinase [Acidimicrobiia bacterium]|nr:HAMP domain-containing sensor histidine kinase [Acidimicrobiia bacterium]
MPKWDRPTAADRASPLWSATAALAAVVALAVGGWAIIDQYLASRPVGEGELFFSEVSRAAAIYSDAEAGGLDPALTVRSIRNDLEVEAVSVLGADGTFLASTSSNRLGQKVDGFIAGTLEDAAFGAIAQPVTESIELDGVEQWKPGDVLYRVITPLSGNGALLVEYDISALLARRARQAAVQPLHLAAGAFSIVLMAGAALLLIGRQGAQRRAVQAAAERRYLQERSAELAEHNQDLEKARTDAERALALAEETNRVRSEFVLMINHELRTPLTSVVTGTELLAGAWDQLDADERQRILADVVSDGRRLKDLITQMLVVARIENRSLQYELRPVNADALRLRLQAMSPRTNLWHADVRLPSLLSDVDTLSALLVSLSDNARTHGATVVEIVPSEGLPFEPMIEVGRRPPAAAYFLVRDNGPGIEEEFIPHIFEKFEKRGTASGTGLGLYLAKLMVEGIDGSISVETGPNGTTMAVGVPLNARALRVAS